MALLTEERVVLAHLDILEEVCAKTKPDISDAIKISTSLRFLFENDPIGKIGRRHLSENVKLICPKDTEYYAKMSLLYMCGGFWLGDKYIAPMCITAMSSNGEIRDMQKPTYQWTELRLGQYKDQIALGFNNSQYSFTRKGIVQFTANFCGGAHYSIAPTEGGKGAQHNKDNYHWIEHVGYALRYDNISGLLIELLGTAHWIINSPSVRMLKQFLQKYNDMRDMSGDTV